VTITSQLPLEAGLSLVYTGRMDTLSETKARYAVVREERDVQEWWHAARILFPKEVAAVDAELRAQGVEPPDAALAIYS
jgi:hypothetical protein